MICLYLDMQKVDRLKDVIAEFDDLKDYFELMKQKFERLIKSEIVSVVADCIKENIEKVKSTPREPTPVQEVVKSILLKLNPD